MEEKMSRPDIQAAIRNITEKASDRDLTLIYVFAEALTRDTV